MIKLKSLGKIYYKVNTEEFE